MSYSPLKTIKICFRRGIILLNNEKLTASYREAESMAESQSGTLAGHELISRTIRKCCTFVFLRTLLLLCSWKIWSGQEKRASNFWAVYCMSWTAVYGAVSIFAYGGRASRGCCAEAGSCQTHLISRACVCEAGSALAVSAECLCKLLGLRIAGGILGCWKDSTGKPVLSLCPPVGWGSRYLPSSGGFDLNLVCYGQTLKKEV